MMNLWKEAQSIAQEAWEESGHDFDEAMDFVHQSCDGHEIAIYYGKAIQFCADHDTSEGEEWLDDCGIAHQSGDSFGSIACRIAFATLLVRSQEALQEIADSVEDE